MAQWAAKLTAVTKVNNTLRIEGKLYRDEEEFAMPPIQVQADTATLGQVRALVIDEIVKLKQGFSAEAQLQNIIGEIIPLN